MRGVEIVGTPQAMADEFREVLAKSKGPEGAKIRENVQKLGKQLRAERDGRDWDTLKAFAST